MFFNLIKKLDKDTVKALKEVGILLLCGFLVWIVFNLSSNHIDHNTETLTKLNGTIAENSEIIRSVRDIILTK